MSIGQKKIFEIGLRFNKAKNAIGGGNTNVKPQSDTKITYQKDKFSPAKQYVNGLTVWVLVDKKLYGILKKVLDKTNIL